MWKPTERGILKGDDTDRRGGSEAVASRKTNVGVQRHFVHSLALALEHKIKTLSADLLAALASVNLIFSWTQRVELSWWSIGTVRTHVAVDVRGGIPSIGLHMARDWVRMRPPSEMIVRSCWLDMESPV